MDSANNKENKGEKITSKKEPGLFSNMFSWMSDSEPSEKSDLIQNKEQLDIDENKLLNEALLLDKMVSSDKISDDEVKVEEFKPPIEDQNNIEQNIKNELIMQHTHEKPFDKYLINEDVSTLKHGKFFIINFKLQFSIFPEISF